MINLTNTTKKMMTERQEIGEDASDRDKWRLYNKEKGVPKSEKADTILPSELSKLLYTRILCNVLEFSSEDIIKEKMKERKLSTK